MELSPPSYNLPTVLSYFVEKVFSGIDLIGMTLFEMKRKGEKIQFKKGMVSILI